MARRDAQLDAAAAALQRRAAVYRALTGYDLPRALSKHDAFSQRNPENLLVNGAALLLYGLCTREELAARPAWLVYSALGKTLPRVAFLEAQAQRDPQCVPVQCVPVRCACGAMSSWTAVIALHTELACMHAGWMSSHITMSAVHSRQRAYTQATRNAGRPPTPLAKRRLQYIIWKCLRTALGTPSAAAAVATSATPQVHRTRRPPTRANEGRASI